MLFITIIPDRSSNKKQECVKYFVVAVDIKLLIIYEHFVYSCEGQINP